MCSVSSKYLNYVEQCTNRMQSFNTIALSYLSSNITYTFGYFDGHIMCNLVFTYASSVPDDPFCGNNAIIKSNGFHPLFANFGRKSHTSLPYIDCKYEKIECKFSSVLHLVFYHKVDFFARFIYFYHFFEFVFKSITLLIETSLTHLNDFQFTFLLLAITLFILHDFN